MWLVLWLLWFNVVVWTSPQLLFQRLRTKEREWRICAHRSQCWRCDGHSKGWALVCCEWSESWRCVWRNSPWQASRALCLSWMARWFCWTRNLKKARTVVFPSFNFHFFSKHDKSCCVFSFPFLISFLWKSSSLLILVHFHFHPFFSSRLVSLPEFFPSFPFPLSFKWKTCKWSFPCSSGISLDKKWEQNQESLHFLEARSSWLFGKWVCLRKVVDFSVHSHCSCCSLLSSLFHGCRLPSLHFSLFVLSFASLKPSSSTSHIRKMDLALPLSFPVESAFLSLLLLLILLVCFQWGHSFFLFEWNFDDVLAFLLTLIPLFLTQLNLFLLHKHTAKFFQKVFCF